jgi:ATP-dependent Clp protease, protease subunit
MHYGQEFRKFAIKGQGLSSLVVDQVIDSTITNFTPAIIEERPMNMLQIDVFSRLMRDRIIFLGVPVDDYVANVIVAQLLFLQSSDPSKDVIMYINSPGGSVYSGLAIYDTMQIVSPDVATVCTGMAASMAAVLLCAGAKGKRSSLPHSRTMIHQPLGGAQGQASDIAITYKQIELIKKELYDIIAKHSGQTFDVIEKSSDRDYWMTADEAKAFGMVDEVLTSKAK